MPLDTAIGLREVKKQLRARYQRIRSGIPTQEKAQAEAAMLTRISGLAEYQSCHTLLCYVSMPGEAGTRALIERAPSDGKTVAVPYCVPNTRELRFFRIGSLSELVPGAFGILEPIPDPSREVQDFHGAVCIVPGLAFDREGFRLGYGGGYYDRFLSCECPAVPVGLCFSACITPTLPRGRFDIACRVVVTENAVIRPGAPQPGGS